MKNLEIAFVNAVVAVFLLSVSSIVIAKIRKGSQSAFAYTLMAFTFAYGVSSVFYAIGHAFFWQTLTSDSG